MTKKTIYKNGFMQSLDIVDDLIKILKANEVNCKFTEMGSPLAEDLKDLIRSYCKRTGRIPHELIDEKEDRGV